MGSNIRMRIFRLLENSLYEEGLTEHEIRDELRLNKSLHSILNSMLYGEKYALYRYKIEGKGKWIYWYPEHAHHMNSSKLKKIEKYIKMSKKK